MHMNTIHILAIDIPTYMTTFINYKTTLSCLNRLPDKHSSE